MNSRIILAGRENIENSNSVDAFVRLVRHGSKLLSEGNSLAAVDAFNQSLALKEHWQSYQGLGWALFRMQQYQSAVDAFKQSLVLKEHWQSYQGLGWALYRMQQYRPAVDAFRHSLALEEHWQSYQGLGWASHDMQQYQSAVNAFRQSLALEEHWQTYQGLGLALYRMQQYRPAVDAFRHSLALEEHWQSYQGLGWASHDMQQYQSAVNAFRQSLALEENWNSYQGLGWALYKTQQYRPAVDAFTQSLALKEHWQSYQGLGWALLLMQQYQSAVDVFTQSLAIEEHWQTYQGLGLTFLRANIYKKSIDAFRKSLMLREDWDTYLGLGRSLLKANQFQEAIEAFRKALALNNLNSIELTAELNSELADAYDGAGNVESSIAAWQVYLSYLEPISSLDPYLGNGVNYEQVNHEQIESINSICASIGLDFNPSFEGGNEASIESWKYLMYLHIPKCGGTSFETPLYLLKECLKGKSCDLPQANRINGYLGISRLVSNHAITALVNSISSNSCNSLKNAFLGLHGAKWSSLHDCIGELFNNCPRIVTTVRDPGQRLLSHIKHQAFQYCASIDDLLAIADNQNSIFNNLMYRQIFDYGLRGDNSYSNSELGGERLDLIEDMDFIDMSDSAVISKVKSSFLSASSFPNIVQTSRFNDSKEREGIHGLKLSSDDIEYVFKYCVEKGFLEKDRSIDYNFLKKRTLKRLRFSSVVEECASSIHPLTFVIFDENRYSIIATKKLLDNPLRVLQELS